MKQGDHLQQAAAPLNNYKFDFGLPGMPKPSGSLKDQKAQPLNAAGTQPSAGWSASPGGWGSSSQSSDQAFDFLGKSSVGGASSPNVTSQPRAQGGGGLSSTYDFLGKPNPVGAGGGGYYGGVKPQTGNVGGTSSFLGQNQAQSKGVDLSGKSWSQSPASKLATAGIAGVIPSSKEDVFGDLLGSALGRSSGPLKQQAPASSSGSFGLGNLNTSLPETAKEPVRQTKPAKPAPFSYASMWGRPAQPPAQKPASKVQPKGTDPFADITKPSNGAPKAEPFTGLSDPFMFGSKAQANPPPQASRASSGDPFGAFMGSNSAVNDQFGSMFNSGKPTVSKVSEDPLEKLLNSGGPASKSAHAHEGWGDAFGSAAESNSFENEGATTELEGLGSAPAGVTGSAAFQKGSTFYKEGQFPNAIKWFSWALELLQKEKGSKGTLIDVLTRRISCYKEIGEYKKAIADCTMVSVFFPVCFNRCGHRCNPLLPFQLEKEILGEMNRKFVL